MEEDLKGIDKSLLKSIRRSFPQTIAKDITDVQPMSAHTGTIFSLKYSHSSDGFTVEDRKRNKLGKRIRSAIESDWDERRQDRIKKAWDEL